MIRSSDGSILNFRDLLSPGDLFVTPFDVGISALMSIEGQQNHAPQLCWITDKLLACVWMAGDQEGTSGMSIMLSILSVDASSWSKPQLISQDSSRSEQNPVLFVIGNRLYLIHTAQKSRDSTDVIDSGSSFSMQWTAMLRMQFLDIAKLDLMDIDTWGFKAWTQSIDLIDQPSFCRNPPFKKLDGSLLLPIYRSLEQGGAFGYDHSLVLTLVPTFSGLFSGVMSVDIPDSVGRVHGSIVLSHDNSELLQFFRSRLADRIYYSKSDLDGVVWTEPEPIQLPNNNSSIQAIRLVSGRLAIIYNRFCFQPDPLNTQSWGDANWPRTRWPLSIALSEDDGATWPWIRDIDTGFGFCGNRNWALNGQLAYPSVIEGRPGELHIAYSWAGRAAIRYICLEEHDIIGFILE